MCARNCRVAAMGAAQLSFSDGSFDIVSAPYLLSVAPEPVKVVHEMQRVCRRGGRIVILNHFKSENPILSRIETAISPLTVHIGFKSDLDLNGFLTQDRKSTRLNSSHLVISYAVFCLKNKTATLG